VIAQILAGQRALRLGSLTPTRDFTFVTDTAGGILAVAACDALVGSATNIGVGREIAMADLAHIIAEMLDVEISIEEDVQRVRPKKSEVERLCCNSTRLQSHTDWRPAYDMRQGLLETTAWFKHNLDPLRSHMYRV
jgi:nucleoside-diphosphate-sugar epimerase